MFAQPVITHITVTELANDQQFLNMLNDAEWNLNSRVMGDNIIIYNGDSTVSLTLAPSMSGRTIRIAVKSEPAGTLLESEKIISSMNMALAFLQNVIDKYKNYDLFNNQI